MIHTVVFKPDQRLLNYIGYFAIREFDASEEPLIKPLCAKEEIHMMFLIGSKMSNFLNPSGYPNLYHFDPFGGPECVFSGLLTSYKGAIVFSGQVKLLTIHFKPTGFYCLFGVSPLELTDQLGDCCDICSRKILQLHEQIQEAKTNAEIFQLATAYLLDRLESRKNVRINSLLKVTEFLIGHSNVFSIGELASSSNMSLKTFERKFVEQVGVSPKLFNRLRRFNIALDWKLRNPDSSWTSICYYAGYYDQNHFIKEFSEFAGKPPAQFFKISPPPAEEILKT